MRIAKEIILLDALPADMAVELAVLRSEILGGFKHIVWPPCAETFTINPVIHGNGVTPIKDPMMDHLEYNGWTHQVQLRPEANNGPVDAAKIHGGVRACLEWETGNAASTYRAMMKIMDALTFRKIDAAFIVVSDILLAKYLTDRVGKDEEVKWGGDMLPHLFNHGHVAMIVMEPDGYDKRVPLIAKQNCGNGVVAKRKGKKPAAPSDQQMNLFTDVYYPDRGDSSSNPDEEEDMLAWGGIAWKNLPRKG
ncbi:hypothetical protein ACOI1H_13285 [Loktanella sp. DJP18]|uniref:hypothetical protein n=1 Tax=Loktanella sp. DJP18 TaxID=3409788 RepID=UPI003BB67F01